MYIWFNRFCTLKIIQHNGPGGDKCDVLSETFIYADVNESYDVKCKYGYEHFRLSILFVHILFIHGFYIKLRYHMHTWPPSSTVSLRSGKDNTVCLQHFILTLKKKSCVYSELWCVVVWWCFVYSQIHCNITELRSYCYFSSAQGILCSL